MDTTQPSVKSGEKISFIILLITIILAPIAFIPTAYAPLDMIKTIVITFGVLLSAIVYFISSFKEKALYIPRHPLFVIGCGVVISIFISTLLSPNIMKSFFGQGYELGTASFLLVLFLGALLTVNFTYKDKDRLLYVYGAAVISFGVVALFHVIRLLGGADILTLGIFQTGVSTMLGKWNDLAIFSAVLGIISYTALRFISLSKLFKVSLTILALLAGFFVLIINSSVVWATVFIILAALGVYEYYISPKHSSTFGGMMKRIPILTLILVVLSFVLAWKGSEIVGPAITKMNLVQTEVSLPWQLTLDVTADTIKESPLFGAGPNRFSAQYLKYKPLVVNPTLFWNMEFNNGFGLIPTFIATQGVVGLIAWLAFIVAFAYSGFKILKTNIEDGSRFFITSTFFSALFLWLISLIYIPSHTVIFLAFILTGLYIAALVSENQISLIKIGQDNVVVTRFVPVIFIAVIVITVMWFIVFAKKTLALGYFEGGIAALSTSDADGLAKAEKNFKRAVMLDKNDTYYQALSETDILKITTLAQQVQAKAQQSGTAPDPEGVKQIAALIDEAVMYTQEAIKIDPLNYYNYLAQARISELALSLQVPNAYESAKEAYTNAIANNPYNPSLYLNLARLEAGQNKVAEAQQYIGSALQLKQNYVDAIFLLSQIQVAQGQIKDAIISVQVASQINPTNPLIFFQLGLLYYNAKDYQSAVEAFNQAMKLDNNYANAQYFLGLSYARLGKNADAIMQFENLATTNPDNEEVALILSNLKAGKSPFADAKAPIDNQPEQRKNLPIKEQTTSKKASASN